MADVPPALTAQDYDPWCVASPLQLLTLLRRLGVTSRVIARWCGVKPSHISMWLHGTRPVPLRYAPILHQRARASLHEADRLNIKEVAAQPTEALQRAMRTEFTVIYDRWKAEVLYDAGTLHQGLVQQYQAQASIVTQPPFTADKRETLARMQEAVLAKYDVLLTLQPEVPSPEDELIERLTQAHAAAQQRRDPMQDPGAQTTNPPDPET